MHISETYYHIDPTTIDLPDEYAIGDGISSAPAWARVVYEALRRDEEVNVEVQDDDDPAPMDGDDGAPNRDVMVRQTVIIRAGNVEASSRAATRWTYDNTQAGCGWSCDHERGCDDHPEWAQRILILCGH